MKLNTLLFLTLLFSLQVIAQPKGYKRNPPAGKPPVMIIEENPMTYYTKSYKFKNGQGYTRSVERFYYGRRNNAADLFRINDYRKGINSTDYLKFNKASFYPDGVYTMPEEKREIAIELFRPILDSVLRENTGTKKLRAEIVVFGYTDETPIDENSPSYADICTQLNKYGISEMEYNNYLSYLRAKDVGDIITTLMTINSDKLSSYDEALLDIIFEGRGIEYPDSTREYELEDDKRKIVKVYWKIYP